MKNRPGSIISLLLLLSLILSACAPAVVVQTDRPPLRVEWTLYEADYTMIIAQEKGFFTQHGVEVEPVFYENYSQLLPDLAEKKLDGGLPTLGDLLRTSMLTPIKAITVYDSGGTVQIMSTVEIANVADIKGKRIGLPVGSTEEKYVREMLSSVGLSINDVQIVDTQVEEVPSQLGKTIDAGYVYPPFNQIAMDQGHKLLFSPTAIAPDVIAFRTDVLNERPEDVRAFINAWFDALQYRLDHMDECNQIIADKTGLSLEDVSEINTVLYNREDNLRLFSKSGSERSIYDITQIEIDFLNLKGQLTSPVNMQAIYDPSFLEQ